MKEFGQLDEFLDFFVVVLGQRERSHHDAVLQEATKENHEVWNRLVNLFGVAFQKRDKYRARSRKDGDVNVLVDVGMNGPGYEERVNPRDEHGNLFSGEGHDIGCFEQ